MSKTCSCKHHEVRLPESLIALLEQIEKDSKPPREPWWTLDDLPMRFRYIAGAVAALLLAYAEHAIIAAFGVTSAKAVWYYALAQFVQYFPIAAFVMIDTGRKSVYQAIESVGMYLMPFSLLAFQAAVGYMAFAPDDAGFGAAAMAVAAGAFIMFDSLPQIERRSGVVVNVLVPLVATVAMFWAKSILFPFWP
jgi:hypothetical protein